jgi:beta-alanine--pyruvate transaminase
MPRAMEAFDKMYWEEDVVMRFTGNILAFAPALIATEGQMDEVVTKLAKVLKTVK